MLLASAQALGRLIHLLPLSAAADDLHTTASTAAATTGTTDSPYLVEGPPGGLASLAPDPDLDFDNATDNNNNTTAFDNARTVPPAAGTGGAAGAADAAAVAAAAAAVAREVAVRGPYAPLADVHWRVLMAGLRQLGDGYAPRDEALFRVRGLTGGWRCP